MNIFHGQWCIVPCGSMTCDANYSGAHDHSHYLCSMVVEAVVVCAEGGDEGGDVGGQWKWNG